jgi:hypothetical protein
MYYFPVFSDLNLVNNPHLVQKQYQPFKIYTSIWCKSYKNVPNATAMPLHAKLLRTTLLVAACKQRCQT